MAINKRGITRIVFVFKNFVIKIPRITYSWQHFLKGLLANIDEHQTWKWNSGKLEQGFSYLLCPVLWCSWGGWILIMKRADVESHCDEMRELAKTYESIDEHWGLRDERYKVWIDSGFGGDDKPDNYGYLNGKLVKVDYGCA